MENESGRVHLVVKVSARKLWGMSYTLEWQEANIVQQDNGQHKSLNGTHEAYKTNLIKWKIDSNNTDEKKYKNK